MQTLDHQGLKTSFTTRWTPLQSMAGLVPFNAPPQIGDLAVAEVLTIARHAAVESRAGVATQIYARDRFVGAFGNRYATDQFEAYLPTSFVDECDLVAGGGVLGEVVTCTVSVEEPTRIRILGAVANSHGQPLNQRDFSLSARAGEVRGQLIAVVGASMNSGKTTTAGTTVRALARAGFRVAAAKITGTAAGKDGRYFANCGAEMVLDFTDAGYPSTYLLSTDELLAVYRTLVSHLSVIAPDYVVIGIADGIFQRETRILLEHLAFRRDIDHVLFAANDSLSAECGARTLAGYGLPLRAISGAMTRSLLATREAEEATGLPVLSIEQMVDGGLIAALGFSSPAAGANLSQLRVA